MHSGARGPQPASKLFGTCTAASESLLLSPEASRFAHISLYSHGVVSAAGEQGSCGVGNLQVGSGGWVLDLHRSLSVPTQQQVKACCRLLRPAGCAQISLEPGGCSAVGLQGSCRVGNLQVGSKVGSGGWVLDRIKALRYLHSSK